MLTNYLIITAATASASLIWRMLKIDHPKMRARVVAIPIFGPALGCGFCATMWFSLAAVLIADPFGSYVPPFTFALGPFLPLAQLVMTWFAVGSGVLVVRSLVVVLMELGGNLQHQHQNRHSH